MLRQGSTRVSRAVGARSFTGRSASSWARHASRRTPVVLRSTAGSRCWLNHVRVETNGVTGWIGIAAILGAIGLTQSQEDDKWDALRKDIEALLDSEDYDDGSYGPVLVRLAWHASGTYDKASGTGGSNGATMRFHPEASDPANAGLEVARGLLEPLKKKYPDVSYADLWTLAGCVAIEAMGGPHIPWKPGRVDAPAAHCCPPQGRLPDAAQGASHVRDVFYRMGFTDREIVALLGAHALGRCHTNRSGFDGPWTRAPIMFTNDYFVELTERTWTVRNWNGPKQYRDESGDLMMLPAEIAMLNDPSFRKWIELYAKDEDTFFQDFAAAFGKLLALGVPGQN